MRLANKGLLKKIVVMVLAVTIILQTVYPVNAFAGTYYKQGNNIIYNESQLDFKTALSNEDLDKVLNNQGEFVEIIIASDSEPVSRSTFAKEDSSWTVELPKEMGKTYYAGYFSKSSKEELGEVNVEAVDAYVEFQVAAIEGTVSATSSVSTASQLVKVELTNVKATFGVSKVKVHFINEAGEDVYQASATNGAAGKYSLTIDAAKLKPSYGKYSVKAEITDEAGVTAWADNETKVDLVGAYTNIKVTSVDKTTGKFVLTTDKVFSVGKIDSVSVQVWKQGKDKDSRTYTCKSISDGKYQCTASSSKFGYKSGKYSFEVIVKLKDGNSFVAAKDSYKLDLTNFIKYKKTNRKSFKKTIYIYNPSIKKNAYLSVSSKKSGGSDIQYYEGKYEDGRLTFVVSMNKLKYAGTINMQLCKQSGSSYSTVKKYTYKAKKSEIQKYGWYYEKASNGKTYKFYYSKGKKKSNLTKILKISDPRTLHIEVNRQACRVTVYAYDKDTKSWCIPVIAFKCSVGVASMPTPTGTYKTDRKHRWKELMGPSWGQYATHIVNGIYFHSIAGSTTDSYGISAYAYNKLGTPASHGCIRLTVRDAKWIYDHGAIGTQVRIYDSAYAGPLPSQYVPKIPAGQHYDPTDPAVK